MLRALALALCTIAVTACVNNAPGAPTVAGKADTGADAATSADVAAAGTDDVAGAETAADIPSVADTAIAPDGIGEDVATLPDAASDAAADSGPDAATPTDAIADADDAVVTDVPPADGGLETTPADTGADTTIDPPKPGLAAPCDTDDDCAGAGTGKKCDLASHSCVLCLTSKDCVAGELCQAKACKLSKICKSDTDCKATNQVCDKVEAVCADCASDLDCDKGKCQDHKCVAVTPCKTSKECPAVCDQAKGTCAECATSNDCKDGNYCAAGTCVPKLCVSAVCAGGKSFTCKADGSGYDAGKSCDDGNVCTEGDVCEAGACKPGPAKVCDDKNPCTNDSCDAKLGCQTANNTAACDDKNACSEVDICGGGVCLGKPKNCDDAQACTADTCKDGTCTNVAQPGTCTDGSACTDGDVCKDGKCAPGKAVNCDDQNPCTVDSCDPAKGCVWVVKDGACDDGNNCTNNDACTAGKCAGVGKQCGDDNPCTDDKCDAGNCSYVANTKPCDDKDACTDGDVCATGKCGGKAKVCDDGNPCTDNNCMSTGCAFVANAKACDDGDGCTVSDTCASGVCKGQAKVCDDSNECTDDACKANGCVFTPNSGACGKPGSCDVCQAGKCVPDTAAGWEETYGGASTDGIRGALPISGGWLLYGATKSKGAGYDDGWVIKVDNDGNVLWEKTYGNANDNALRFGIVGNDGNYVFTGYSYQNTGGMQLWVLKLDANGAVVWEKFLGSSSYSEYGWGIAANKTGYLVAGEYKYTQSSTTYQKGWILQLDETGNQNWEKQLTDVYYAEAIAPSADGNLYVAVSAYNKTSNDLVVKKLKPGGSEIWSTAIGGASYNDSPTDLLAGSDGAVYVTGKQYVVLNGSNVERLVVSRLDGNGAVQWSKTYGGDYYTESYALAEVGDSLVAVGRAYQNSQYDGYLVRVAKADGAMVWEQKVPFSGAYNEALFGVSAAPGGLIATGYAYISSSAGEDGWVLRLNAKGALACNCTGSTCDDGNGCTTDTCVLGLCKGKQVASGTICKEVAIPVGKCDTVGKCITLCGNKYCDSGENNENCAQDCTTKCGNGVCESGENNSNCASDCKHICDTNCGGKPAGTNCYCDATCKTQGDCCNAAGTAYAGKACYGSTCSYCK